MLKKVFICFSLAFLISCSPKDTSVESKPFPEPETDGFTVLSLATEQHLQSAMWLFWQDQDNMAPALRLLGGMRLVGESLRSGTIEKARLEQAKEDYLVDQLGPDHMQNWLSFEAQKNQRWQELQAAHAEYDDEQNREDPDQERLDNIEARMERLGNDLEQITLQMRGIQAQAGVEEFFEEILMEIQQELVTTYATLKALQDKLQNMNNQIRTLVEWIATPPTLKVHEREDGLFVELENFQHPSGAACSTETGLIRDLIYDKDAGKISFTAICDQSAVSDPTEMAIYKIMLERIPNRPSLTLEGNMARCIAAQSNPSQCLSLDYGQVSYQ